MNSVDNGSNGNGHKRNSNVGKRRLSARALQAGLAKILVTNPEMPVSQAIRLAGYSEATAQHCQKRTLQAVRDSGIDVEAERVWLCRLTLAMRPPEETIAKALALLDLKPGARTGASILAAFDRWRELVEVAPEAKPVVAVNLLAAAPLEAMLKQVRAEGMGTLATKPAIEMPSEPVTTPDAPAQPANLQ